MKKVFLVFIGFVTLQSCNTYHNLGVIKSSVTNVDSIMSINFDVKEKQINFVLKNTSKNPIKLLWDEVLYIDSLNISRVINSEVDYINRGQKHANMVILPGTTYKDYIIPNVNIKYKESESGGDSYVPANWYVKPLYKKAETKKFTIYIPIIYSNKKKEYRFKFKISS